MYLITILIINLKKKLKVFSRLDYTFLKKEVKSIFKTRLHMFF